MDTSMIGRRTLFLGGGVVVAGAATTAVAGWDAILALLTEETDARRMTPTQAHRAALAGAIVLVDIRRPDEWEASGSGEGAVRLDLRRPDFAERLAEIAGGTDRPVALICAGGVRSARTANRLADAGFTDLIDVPEGMLGSTAGPGWIASGLPLDRRPAGGEGR